MLAVGLVRGFFQAPLPPFMTLCRSLEGLSSVLAEDLITTGSSSVYESGFF